MSDIAFRRIRGRIVPIKLNKSEKKDLGTGAIIAAVGAATPVVGGAVYKQVTRQAMKFASKGADAYLTGPRFKKGVQMSFDDLIKANSARAEGLKKMGRAAKLEKVTPFIRKSSTFVGAALVAYGVSKAFKALAPAEHKGESQAVGAAAGAAAYPLFVLGAYPKGAIKNAVQAAKQGDLFKKSVPLLTRILKARF